jgi:formylglycine-generating enzyme required for sulfatase activity
VAWKIILTPFSVVPSASWRSPGFAQGPHHPVVRITWQDARGYAEWLASRTDHPYRLLYEAE